MLLLNVMPEKAAISELYEQNGYVIAGFVQLLIRIHKLLVVSLGSFAEFLVRSRSLSLEQIFGRLGKLGG